MTTYEESATYTSDEPMRPLVRWGPSFAGAITAIAVTTMVMAFWLALGYGSSVNWLVDNMQWFFLGTALFGLLSGGVVSGMVAAKRGVRVGTVDGMMVWGLVLVAALIPLSLRTLALVNSGASSPATRTALGVSSGNLWALFGALVGGLFCAIFGGMIGGAGRPTTYVEQRPPYERGRFEGGVRPPLREPGSRRVS